MAAVRIVTAALLGLLALVWGQLWLGDGGYKRAMDLKADLATQRALNDTVRERNTRLSAELTDLKEGLEMVEERARGELGMLKADELLVLIKPPRLASAPP